MACVGEGHHYSHSSDQSIASLALKNTPFHNQTRTLDDQAYHFSLNLEVKTVCPYHVESNHVLWKRKEDRSMSGIRIGQVTHYYNHLGVAVLALSDTVHVGDTVHILGHSTDVKQAVTSLQIEHKSVSEAGPGQDVALKVVQRVHPHDAVFKITGES